MACPGLGWDPLRKGRTMTKRLMSGLAAVAVLMAAPTIFAQDSKVETKQAAQEAEEAMKDAVDVTEDAMDDAEEMAEDAMNKAQDMADETTEATEDVMDTDVDVDVEMGEPVACPEGTEAQDD